LSIFISSGANDCECDCEAIKNNAKRRNAFKVFILVGFSVFGYKVLWHKLHGEYSLNINKKMNQDYKNESFFEHFDIRQKLHCKNGVFVIFFLRIAN
jgi:hypothetical protein